MELKLPDIGEGVHEGELVKWLVKVGDTIKVDQPIIEIMTDKATVEIPSPFAGVVQKIHCKEGDIIKVGQVIITYDAAGASAAAPVPAKAAPTPSAAPQRTTAPVAMSAKPAAQVAPAPARTQNTQSTSFTATPGNVLATPATRRLARDLGIDLTQITPTGPNGRVTKEDVQKFSGAVAAGPQMPVQNSMQTRGGYTPQASVSTPAPTTLKIQTPSPLVPGQRETLIPFRGIRRKIAEAMTKSRSTIAEFTYVDECDISELVAFRKEAKADAEKMGVKLTYMPFIVKAVIQGLKEFPYMNSELDEANGNIILKNYYNIGMAVDTEQGLIVPVIKDADKKSVLQIAHETQVLSEKARAGKLSVDDLRGGTFSITNAGTIGGMLATPVINFPEVAIFGVHKISKRPIVKIINGKDEIVIADMIWLSVAIDHRIVDGAMGARFMNVVMDYLSNPKKLILI